MEYKELMARRISKAGKTGFDAVNMLACMEGFRGFVVRLCCQRGRSAAFLDTGLGKTTIELEFARQCHIQTGKPSLILTPLAVSRQMEREGQAFGYDCGMFPASSSIVVCNYDRLRLIDADDYGAVILDESSIIKNFSGKTTMGIIEQFKNTTYKLCATATPAPNDHMELGTHSEFLGVMGQTRMLMRWFINDTSTASQTWRLKKHAISSFWDWVATWAVMASNPSDLGFPGDAFILPKLNVVHHRLNSGAMPTDGLFGFDVSATGIFATKRLTADARVQKAVEIVSTDEANPWVVWCDTDSESADLRKSLPDDFVEVKGSQSADDKIENLEQFALGQKRGIITKPSVAGAGLNWQHCHNVVFVGRTFSYERFYQAVRRCWRFGQKQQVNVHIIVSEGEDQISIVLGRKSDDHQSMQRHMISAQRRLTGVAIEDKTVSELTHKGALPSWI